MLSLSPAFHHYSIYGKKYIIYGRTIFFYSYTLNCWSILPSMVKVILAFLVGTTFVENYYIWVTHTRIYILLHLQKVLLLYSLLAFPVADIVKCFVA